MRSNFLTGLRAGDWIPALCALVFSGVFGLIAASHPTPLAAALAAVAAALPVPALLWRRFPRAAGVASTALLAAWILLALPEPSLSLSPHFLLVFLTCFSWARWCSRPWFIAACALAGVFGIVSPVTRTWWQYDMTWPLMHWFIGAVVIYAARTARLADAVRKREIAALTRENELLERELEYRSTLAVVTERNRMAHDIHDALAHSLTLIRLQAHAGSIEATRHPERAADALSLIADTAGTALENVRAIVAALKADAPHAERTPAVSLVALPDVIAEFRSAGARVTAQLPDARALAAAEQTAAPLQAAAIVRCIREGLTNALRYGEPTAPIDLDLTLTEGAAEVTVLSRARAEHRDAGEAAPARGAGIGLTGVRERLSAVNGTLTAGWDPDAPDRWRMSAHIPVGVGG